MIVVDARVLIAFLDRADAHHEAAVEWLADASPPLVVHPITLAEVLVAPTRNGSAEQAWAVLHSIGVELHSEPTDPLQLARLRVNTGLRMPDCCVIDAARHHGCAVATFDDRLRRASATG
jgi:predicted nucleic acid-binding protein